MKKIIALFLIFSQINIVLASNLTSTNDFPFVLEQNDIPDGGGGGSNGGNGNNDSSLGSGAITAITLGSIGVVGLGAITYFLYRKLAKDGLVLNNIIGCDSPILSICLDKCSSLQFIEKHKEYPLLKKAIEEQTIKPCPNCRYILIPDTEIKNKNYDMYIFELKDGLNNIKVTQAVENINQKVKFNLYEDKTQETEIKLSTLKNNQDILIKYGINSNSKYGVLTVVHNNLKENLDSQKYAIVIELSR